MKNDASIKEYLRQRSLKATPIRVELIKLMSYANAAVPYSEIQTNLKSFDRVTLYRTINSLIKSGIVHKASTSGDETYYALCSQACSMQCHNHEHIHFICQRCQEVSCIHVEQSIKISLPDYQIEEVSVEVSGICKKCLSND